MAFIAGIILMNVMSEELPTGKERRPRYFLVGVTVFVVMSILCAADVTTQSSLVRSRAGGARGL